MSWSQIDAVSWVIRHPLNRAHRARALLRWTVAQVRSQLFRQHRAVPFIDRTSLYIGPGLTVPNMQFYAGIGEMDVMGFLMHYLRPDDLFIDVGANVGVITVLGAGVAGAETIAFEPDPSSVEWLDKNLALNDLTDRVRVHRAALGDTEGTLTITDHRGAANRATSGEEIDGQTVPCHTLDAALDGATPTVLKVDVEGYELPVLRGAANSLARPELAVVILELRGHGKRYGFDEDDIRNMMSTAGFEAYSYDPVRRHLVEIADCPWPVRDTIFIRDQAAAIARIKDAPPRRVIWGQQI